MTAKEKNGRALPRFVLNKGETKMKKKQELGRSMVEMLGVLAIIGVLTVGGLAAYNRAINKNIANNIVHEVTLRATTIVSQLEMKNPANLAEFDEKIMGEYPVSVEEFPDTGSFVLTVSDIPEAAVKQLVANKFGGLHYWAVGVNSASGYASSGTGRLLASQTTGNVLIKSALADLGEKNSIWMEFKNNMQATPEFPTDEIKKLGTEYSRCVYSE